MPSRNVKFTVATTTQNENGAIVTRYHGTPVVSVHPDGSFTLRAAGWHTATTKHRMNQFAPWKGVGDGIFQKSHSWFVQFDGKIIPFEEGMTIKYVTKTVEEVEVS